MPSRTKKQHKAMCAAGHSKEMSKKMGIPQHVGREFCDADKKEGKHKGKRK